MRVNPVQPTFKGIVKVNAPINQTYKMLSNREQTSRIKDKHLHALLSDKEYDEIEIVNGKNDNECYILTGEDAKTIHKRFHDTVIACQDIGKYYGASEEFKTTIESYWDSYYNFVQNIVETTKPYAEINYDKDTKATIIKYLNA